MATVVDVISDELCEWIERQPMFFVGTAPLSAQGHVNLSPKGLDSFRVLGPTRVAYLDLTGSGAETIAHLRENGRITIMFCAFAGPPRILRLYGTGTPHPHGSAGFDRLVAGFAPLSGMRAVIEVDVDRIQTSCGFGVPEMERAEQRRRLLDWAEAKGPLEEYWGRKNSTSIDGLPSLG